MALQGKIVSLAHGVLGFEYFATDLNKPIRYRQVWQIGANRTRGMSYAAPAEAVGRDASLVDGRVSCYLGNGNYLHGELPELGKTVALFVDEMPIPAPKVKRTTQTRWHYGRWEKLTRKGWAAA